MNVLDFLKQRLTKIQILRFGISLLLATLLWGWVTQLQDPLEDTTFTGLPIAVNGLSDSLFLVTTLKDGSVTISGPQSRVEDVRSADVTLSIDLSDIDEPGSYEAKVEVAKPNGVDSESLEPKEVQIQVEDYVTKNFPLEIENSLPEDDPRQVKSVSPNVNQVTVSGPSSIMERVHEIRLPVTVLQQITSFQALFDPYAVDIEGQRINDVTILPGQVSAFVVSVIPVIAGSPAEGYSVQQRSAVPDTILVDGPAELLESLLFVNTSPVNISGATQSVSERVGIVGLPEGVTVVEPQDATVEVRVAIEDTTNTAQTIPSLPVEILGLDPDLTATIDPETVSITIDAPQSVLQSLAASNIKVRVSATDLTPGTYTVELEVSVPEGVTLVSNTPTSVELTITDPAATPGASPEGGG
jgi:YbbR domain-containing protein